MVRDVGQTGARGGLVRDFSGEMVVYGNMRRLVLCCGRWALAQAQDGPGREAPGTLLTGFMCKRYKPHLALSLVGDLKPWTGQGPVLGYASVLATIGRQSRKAREPKRSYHGRRGGFSGKGDTSTRQEQSLCLMCAGSWERARSRHAAE